jgi:C4-dicarboxylate transporter DctQ subunit
MDKIIKYSGYLASWLFITIGFIVFYEVIMRYIFNSPTIWVEEISRFLQIWATYLALTYSFHKKDFIRITFIYDKLSSHGQKFLDIISHIFIIFFSSVVVYYGWIIAKESFDVNRTSSSMLDLPAFISEVAIPLCFGFLLFRVIIEFINTIYSFFKS